MPGQVGDLPHDTRKLLMWRRPSGHEGLPFDFLVLAAQPRCTTVVYDIFLCAT